MGNEKPADDIAAIAARAAAATPGPWVEHGRHVQHDEWLALGREVDDMSGLGCEVDGPPPPTLRGDYALHADAEFIAHAREDIPYLLAALDAERALADRLAEAVHQALHGDHTPTSWAMMTAALAAYTEARK